MDNILLWDPCHACPPIIGGYFACSSLVLYGIRAPHNRTFPCMEATYPYAIKNQPSLDIPRPMRLDQAGGEVCLPLAGLAGPHK